MKLQQLLSLTRKAVDTYHLIDEGDHIAIGLSGGKDSLALLYALHGLQRFYPKKFSLTAVSVDLGMEGFDLTPVTKMCEELGISHHIIKTQIRQIVFEERKEKNPCSLCAKMRKGALNNEALRIGCNKIAYAHHQDDAIETMLMSLIYEGRFHTFSPYTHWDKTGLSLIRPFIYIRECDIIGFQNKYLLPVAKNPCPADGNTKRQYIKSMLANINRENPGVKERLFHSIINGTLEEWNLPYS